MLKRLASSILAIGLLVTPALAQSERIQPLLDALLMDDVLDIMRLEGIADAQSLGETLFSPDRRGQWNAAIEQMHEPERLAQAVEQRLDAALASADDALLQEMLDFLTGPTGTQVIMLESTARRALLDSSIEDAAQQMYAQMVADNDPRVDLLARFIRANDLIESNVAASLNSSLGFYTSLAEAGVPGFNVGPEELLAEVISQEPAIRADLTDWLHGYLALAFRPLADEQIEEYIDFSRSRAGQRLNTALFVAFDAVFAENSRLLGREVARMLLDRDI